MTREKLLETSFLTGTNADFIADLYGRYLKNPRAVDPSWAKVFDELNDAEKTIFADLAGPSWQGELPVRADGFDDSVPYESATGRAAEKTPEAAASEEDVRAATMDSIRALMMIRAYRVRGHLMANFDPLGLEAREPHPELDPATYGFGEEDMDRPIFIDNVLGLEEASLREILEVVRETYCGNIGVEFMHMGSPEEKAWIQTRIESIRNQTEFTLEGKKAILERLTAAEAFEQFLDRKYTGTKRFGLEGGEALIPALEQIIKRGGQLGLREVVLGMPHRGRLNVLANFMGKPFQAIFSEFQGTAAHPDDVEGSGDVKYHLGTSSDREFDDIKVHLSLTANPSHLEAVDPVVVGKVRAKQTLRGDQDRKEVMGLLMHGDAAFAGQGIVAEVFELSHLRGYRSGGTIHVVVNNQIGFTTVPRSARSSPYPTDVAKMVQAPIFHVNGDDPEAVVHVARIATEYRQQFGKDVVIDMFCYRRHGHNEGDEPAFTQPLMYRAIRSHPTTRQVYAEKLVRDGIISKEDPDALVSEWDKRLEEAFEAANSFRPNKADWLEGAWSGLSRASEGDRRGDTAVVLDRLKKVGGALVRVPEGFHIHRGIKRVLDRRAKMIESGEGFDWAMAEALAFGTLLDEGVNVRLSGQDSPRGTFSQRHATLVHQDSEEKYAPLENLSETQGHFEAFESPLSEFAVLGFDYGYSLADPNTLVLWEAQFGDFANGAQVMIDQFISSGESKWLRMSGLVMLLPHGYEGQGPEHSTARLERYLQLCADDNMQVVNCTTPANYFHVLRRQIHRDFRKPLIIMTPKSLLRHKLCVSSLSDMAEGSSFHRVFGETDELIADKEVRRVVLCSGKVYYDLLEERRARKIEDVAILRLEQFYPFPEQTLAAELGRYPNAEIVWCQEEPENMGGWHFVDRRLEAVMNQIGTKARRPVYVGRCPSASTASGMLKRHQAEQAKLVNEALTVA